MLINSGNKRISQKLMSADSNTNDRNDAPLKPSIQPSKIKVNEVKYEYDGVFINPVFNSFNVAEIKHATPVKFEEVRELRKLPPDNSIGRHISYNDGSVRKSRISRVQEQRPRSYERSDENLRPKNLSYDINDGEPIKWLVAKDLITPNWEQLKHNSEISRNFRYNFIDDDYENQRKPHRQSEPPPKSRNTYNYIDSKLSERNDSPRVRTEAQSNNQVLYSQLPFKRLTTFQNPDDDVKIIKKVIKDPDTDEILSVKSFLDYTTTVNITPSEKRKYDEKISKESDSLTNNNIHHNHEISVVKERKNSSTSSSGSFKPQSFPSPPTFSDEPKTSKKSLANEQDEPEKQNEIDEIYLNPNTSFFDSRLTNDKPVLITPAKSLTTRLNEKSQLPLNNLINELSKFRPDSLRPTPMGTSKKVEYNFINDKQQNYSPLPPSKSGSMHSSPRLPPPPLKLIVTDSELSPRILSSVTLPPESGLPDNLPQTDRGDWSAVMKTFDENIAGYTPKSPKSLNDSLANLRSEIEENEKLSDAQLF